MGKVLVLAFILALSCGSSRCLSPPAPFSPSFLRHRGGLSAAIRGCVVPLRGGEAAVEAAWHTRESTLVLFDIDGTLTEPRKQVHPDVLLFLKELRNHVTVGVVGGSDLSKAKEQLGNDYLDLVDFAFAENGLVAFENGHEIAVASLRTHLGEKNIRRIIDWTLKYLGNLDIPIKRGTFVEFRNGLINISPIGRNCNQAERDDFEQYDQVNNIRAKMVTAFQAEFSDLNLTCSVGGQISFDVFPSGWDKTYCLQFVEKRGFKEIHFFGDKTGAGGNDHEIFEDSRTKGHTVCSPEDTVRFCNRLFIDSKNPPQHYVWPPDLQMILGLCGKLVSKKFWIRLLGDQREDHEL